MNWIGIINQLATTRANQLLSDIDLPMPQFAVLNHFSHRPGQGRTVTDVACAMQQPQPGMTKPLQKLEARGYLEARRNPADGRSRLLYLTSEGSQARVDAIHRLSPVLDQAFSEMSQSEMEQLFSRLDYLKCWLDENRA